jgi:uncharacterized YigZ family protein
MPEKEFYYTPAQKKRTRFTVQGSRFIATLYPASSEQKAELYINAVSREFPDATHHAYAYRIGNGSSLVERCSDAREPAGTAGLPMLQLLQGKDISDAVVIATRYFGGTKLGIGGLTRAYRDCARISTEQAELIQREPLCSCKLELSYRDYGTVNRLIESVGGRIDEVNYLESVTVTATMPLRLKKSFSEDFETACRGNGKIDWI